MGDSSGSGLSRHDQEKRAELEAKIVHAVEEKEPLKVIEKAVFDLDKWLYDTDPAFKNEKDKLEDSPQALTKAEEQRLKKLSSFARFRKLSAKESAELDDLHKRSKKA